MTLHKLHEFINSEGPILSLYRNENQVLYIMGLGDKGSVRIFARTNPFLLSLYQESRITLKELFMLRMDENFILLRGALATKHFFEFSVEEEIPVLNGLVCGNDLFDLLPTSMKYPMSKQEILDLSAQSESSVSPAVMQTVEYSEPGIFFFGDDSLRVVTLHSEQYNRDEHEYILSPTRDGKKLFSRINPYSLFLFLQNRISVKELFLCRQDDQYIIADRDQTYSSNLSNDISEMIDTLIFADMHYHSLPPGIKVENAIEQWKLYSEDITISGKGILPARYRHEVPVELEIK